MKNLLAAVAVGVLLWAGYHYLQTQQRHAWTQGYAVAQAGGEATLRELQRRHAATLAERSALAHQQLQQAVASSHTAERDYLMQQQQLAAQIKQLQEQLDAALIDQPDCHFTAGWVRHYSAALGLPGADAATGGATDPADAAHPAASPASLLQHAQQYGQWCRANTQQLTALQRLIRSHQ